MKLQVAAAKQLLHQPRATRVTKCRARRARSSEWGTLPGIRAFWRFAQRLRFAAGARAAPNMTTMKCRDLRNVCETGKNTTGQHSHDAADGSEWDVMAQAQARAWAHRPTHEETPFSAVHLALREVDARGDAATPRRQSVLESGPGDAS
jgi:hypothetical protein